MLAGEHRFTRVGSTGGFLREGNTTLLIGAEDSQVDDVLLIIGKNCETREQYMNVMPPEAVLTAAIIPSPVKVLVGGAVVFVLDVSRVERY